MASQLAAQVAELQEHTITLQYTDTLRVQGGAAIGQQAAAAGQDAQAWLDSVLRPAVDEAVKNTLAGYGITISPDS